MKAKKLKKTNEEIIDEVSKLIAEETLDDTDLPKCGCGRSISGYCDGSHNLTEEQYQQHLKEQFGE